MSNDLRLGLIKVLGLPADFCLQGSASDWIKQIAESLAVQLPEDISNVVIGNSEPEDLQSTALWIRQDSSGTFAGLYVVSGGNWTQIYPVPGQLFWVYRNPGSSTDVPEGFIRADDASAGLDSSIVTFLTAEWMPDPDSPGDYLVYQVVTDF